MMEEIEKLIDEAAKAPKSEDALRFSQAALNIAHAMIGLKSNGLPFKTLALVKRTD